jgi:Fe-S cluster assembly protein SufD
VYEAFTLTLGSKLSRNQIHTELLGQHAQCNLYGVNLLGADQIGDTTITVDHIAPECRSEQFYRSVLGGSSRGIYQGKVFVDKLAQKTDGYQLSNALILNEGAEMNSKPELEIYADDVKCSHGSTSGMLDDEQLFYLRSRGVPADQARSLLIKAFVMEVVERLSDSSIRSLLNEQIDTWLSKLR